MIRSSRIWMWFLVILALVLFFIEPAPYGYLITMAFLGASYAGFMMLVWRRGSTLLFFVLVVYVSGSSTLVERLFQIDSQYKDVQGIALAFAFSGLAMAVFRDRMIQFIADPSSENPDLPNKTEKPTPHRS